jgi:toluene monooxygenase system ferredoxin subunit
MLDTATEVVVANAGDLVIGTMRQVQASPDVALILLRLADETVVAFAALCPHQKAPLIDGELNRTELSCPAHRWRFNVETGAGVFPRSARLKTFATRIREGVVIVDLADLVAAATGDAS